MQNELNELKVVKGPRYLYEQHVIGFVKISKDILSIIANPDEGFVEDLLNLTEAINNSAARKIVKRDINNLSRKQDNIVSPEYKDNILTLSEYLLASQNSSTVQREKGKYLDKIHQYISSMCQQGNYGLKRKGEGICGIRFQQT